MEKNYFASIEFGSLYTTILVVSYFNEKIDIIASYKKKSTGYYDGKIVNADNFNASINSIVTKINKKYKILIDEIILILPNNDHLIMHASVTNKILTERQIIGIDQIDLINKQILNSSKDNYNIISAETISYTLDDNTIFRTPPISKQSSFIKVSSSVSTLPKDLTDPLINAITNNNIKVLTKYINCFCASKAVMDKYDLEENSIHINILQEITTISAFSKNILRKSAKINFGVETLIDYLAYNLKCDKEQAIKLFESYFVCDNDLASDVIFDKTNNLSEKRISGIILNRLNIGLNEILDKMMQLVDDLKFNEGYKIYISGYLNDYEDFDKYFSNYSELNITKRNIDLIGVHEQCYLDNYGAILLFINQNHKMIKNRLEENVEININNNQENNNSRFRDIFDE